MDLEYFKDQICEELHGAKCYIKNAIEIKAMAPNWSPLLVEMSAAELKHAANLYTMAQEYYTKVTAQYNEVPHYLKEMWDCIVDNYTEKTAKVKYMHEMYNK